MLLKTSSMIIECFCIQPLIYMYNVYLLYLYQSSQGSMVNAMAMPTLNDSDRSYGYKYSAPPPPPKDINRSRIPNHQVMNMY